MVSSDSAYGKWYIFDACMGGLGVVVYLNFKKEMLQLLNSLIEIFFTKPTFTEACFMAFNVLLVFLFAYLAYTQSDYYLSKNIVKHSLESPASLN